MHGPQEWFHVFLFSAKTSRQWKLFGKILKKIKIYEEIFPFYVRIVKNNEKWGAKNG